MTNPQIVFDINKVSYMTFWWFVDGKPNITSHNKPHGVTVNGQPVSSDTLDIEGKRMIDVARERNMIDKWIPAIDVHLLYGKKLRFIGNKAMEIWKKWCSMQFNK